VLRSGSTGKTHNGTARAIKPWDLIAMRKKVKAAALEALANSRPGRKKQVVVLEQYQQVSKELTETKDALAAVGHELSLLKKRVN